MPERQRPPAGGRVRGLIYSSSLLRPGRKASAYTSRTQARFSPSEGLPFLIPDLATAVHGQARHSRIKTLARRGGNGTPGRPSSLVAEDTRIPQLRRGYLVGLLSPFTGGSTPPISRCPHFSGDGRFSRSPKQQQEGRQCRLPQR